MALPAVTRASAPLGSVRVDQRPSEAVVNRDPVLNADQPRAVRRERRQPQGLAAPRPQPLRPPSQTITRAVNAITGNATLALRVPAGRAWDLALVATLEVQWRSMRRELARLTPAEREQLATAVTNSLVAQGRIRASDADTRRIAAYTVHLQVQRAAEELPPPATTNAQTSAVAATPQVTEAEPFNGAPGTAIASLQRLAAQPATPQRAADAQRIVEGATRRLIAAGNRPALDQFIAQLARINLPVSNLPVEFRDGWGVAVNDGRVVGTTNSRVHVGMVSLDGNYRTDLRDITTGRAYWLPRQVDLLYEFDASTRTVSAAAYARTLRSQHDWKNSAGWPRNGNPYDLRQVTAHVQRLLDTGTPPNEVFTRWQQYLTSFYIHGSSLNAQGVLQVGGMQDFNVGRLEADTQGVVDDMLSARTGQRLLDCEFFAAITTHVFGGLRRADGQPRFQTYWVLLDTHAAAVVAERPAANATQPLNWAFVNNNYVMARGTSTVRNGLDPAITEAVGKNILSGRPTIFGIDTSNRSARRTGMDLLVGPRVGANMYDGETTPVTELDRRAYWVYAETRKNRFSEHAKFEDFVRNWSPSRPD